MQAMKQISVKLVESSERIFRTFNEKRLFEESTLAPREQTRRNVLINIKIYKLTLDTFDIVKYIATMSGARAKRK